MFCAGNKIFKSLFELKGSMRAQPFTCLSSIPSDQLPTYEFSDRIVLPELYLRTMSYAENDLVMLSNKLDQSVCGTVYGTHNGNAAAIYIPSWMMLRLDHLDFLSVSQLPKRHCSAIQIKPHSDTFRKHPDFLKLLNKAIVNYHSLTKGHKLPLFVEGTVEYVTIENFLPSLHNTYFVYNCGRVDIQVLDSLETEPPPKSFLYKGAVKQEPMTFIGRGHTLGGTIDHSIPSSKAAADAARKRLLLLSSGKRPY